jgi:hypothetical protein
MNVRSLIKEANGIIKSMNTLGAEVGEVARSIIIDLIPLANKDSVINKLIEHNAPISWVALSSDDELVISVPIRFFNTYPKIKLNLDKKLLMIDGYNTPEHYAVTDSNHLDKIINLCKSLPKSQKFNLKIRDVAAIKNEENLESMRFMAEVPKMLGINYLAQLILTPTDMLPEVFSSIYSLAHSRSSANRLTKSMFIELTTSMESGLFYKSKSSTKDTDYANRTLNRFGLLDPAAANLIINHLDFFSAEYLFSNYEGLLANELYLSYLKNSLSHVDFFNKYETISKRDVEGVEELFEYFESVKLAEILSNLIIELETDNPNSSVILEIMDGLPVQNSI